MGLIAVIDRHALIAYTRLGLGGGRPRVHREARGELSDQKRGREDPLLPAVPQVATAEPPARLKAYQQEFGMTPSARSRIQVGGPVEKEEKARRYFSLPGA
jgi:hypothetical protein